MKMPLLACVGSAPLFIGGTASAGQWTSEPNVGLSSEYSSNPELRIQNAAAETHAALTVYAPAYFRTETFNFSILPRFRLSDSRGYESLASNFAHLDLQAVRISELGSLTASAGYARDSSLYRDTLSLTGTLGVRRDTKSAGLDWQQTLTERTNLDVGGAWTEARYDQPPGATSLTDYRYSSFSPSLSVAVSERDKLQVLGSLGRYESLDGTTQSQSTDLRLGFQRQAGERWSVFASAGLSRANNRINRFIIGPVESTQTGTVYDLRATRQATRFSVVAEATRSLRPSGYAFLTRETSYEISGNYALSEHLGLSGGARWQETANPQFGSQPRLDGRSINFRMALAWQWRANWYLQSATSHIHQDYGQAQNSAAANGVSVEVFHSFKRIELR